MLNDATIKTKYEGGGGGRTNSTPDSAFRHHNGMVNVK